MNEWMNESWHQSIRVMHNQFRSIPKSIPLLIIAVLHCIELVPEFAFIWRSQSFEWLIRTSPNLHWWPHPADGFNSNCGECDAVFCCCLLKRGSFPPLSFYVSGPHCIAGDVTGALVQSNGPMANNFFFYPFLIVVILLAARSLTFSFIFWIIFFLLFNDVIHWRLAPFRAD